MSTDQIVVRYREIEKAFHGNAAALEKAAGQAAGPKSRVKPGTQARMLAHLSNALHQLELAEARSSVMVTAQDQTASLLQTFLASRARRAGKLEPVDSGALEAKFDNHDVLGWMGSFFSFWKKIRPHKLLAAAAQPDTVSNQLRVALFGDWGTGLYGAPVTARSIAQDGKGYQLLLHLGDVYYSGDDGEIRDRLLKTWPRVSGALNRTLNANHEMYTGGKAYFTRALPEFKQKASYFALQNDFWTLIGLDSAHKDHDLAGDQVAWLEAILRKSGNRRTILFSHHQPYSLLDDQGPQLTMKLAALLDGNKIFAWYWGHEHRCVLYDRHPMWGLLGRCIGHGGFPYFRDKQLGAVPSSPKWKTLEGKNMVPGAIVLDGPNPYVEGHEKKYGPQGYVTLEFQDEHLNEIVNDADGTVLHERQIA
ncbi:MAG: metallophosphoesterase family protein [Acidobacteriota bacterium]